jgi:hypothetical protein
MVTLSQGRRQRAHPQILDTRSEIADLPGPQLPDTDGYLRPEMSRCATG